MFIRQMFVNGFIHNNKYRVILKLMASNHFRLYLEAARDDVMQWYFRSTAVAHRRIQEFEKEGAQLPPPLPSFPFHPLPFPSIPSRLPPISFPFPLPSPSLRSRPPLIQLGGLGSAVSSPSGIRGRVPARKSNFGIFGAQERHLMARI